MRLSAPPPVARCLERCTQIGRVSYEAVAA
jgi:hypothetical protein